MPTIKTIWVNGCFDVLHRGHIELFKYARSLGTKLVVGVDTDSRVKAAKGESRPYNSLDDRVHVLHAIRYIDQVVSFDTDKQLEHYIVLCNPAIMVVGSDWEGKKVIGSQYVPEIKYFERIEGYSTTHILENI